VGGGGSRRRSGREGIWLNRAGGEVIARVGGVKGDCGGIGRTLEHEIGRVMLEVGGVKGCWAAGCITKNKNLHLEPLLSHASLLPEKVGGFPPPPRGQALKIQRLT